MAVVWGIGEFRDYLEGFYFRVITDRSSLRWLYNLRNPTDRLARWDLELQGYVFDIVHRNGTLHHVPDALSWLTEDAEAPVSKIGKTEDPWYLRRIQTVQDRPKIFPDWKIENGMLYRHKPNVITNDLLTDLES